MAGIIEQLENLQSDQEEAAQEGSALQDAIDEIQGELDSWIDSAESYADQAWQLVEQLDELDPAYDEAYRIWQDMDEVVGNMR